MEELPLEMKQRICSFLHANPKLLKPVRLVSKDFASAAAPYLIPRLFLFKHIDSCDEVQEIIQHPVFSKYVNTLVVDVNRLQYPTNFEEWVDYHPNPSGHYPAWWKFKPEDVTYDEHGDPILTTFESRASWRTAAKAFDQALDDTTRSLKHRYHDYWIAQKYLAKTAQLDPKFKARFWRTVAKAFETCPSLANLIIAPPDTHSQTALKTNRVFAECLATEHSYVVPASHLPLECSQEEILQATKNSRVSLNSLTIVDFPIGFADFSLTTGLWSVESLKHIRIGYNRLYCNPKAFFDFNLEKVLQAAQSLQTLWVEMPPRQIDEYDANDLLRAISSKHFRDILLHNATVSEESLVSFLLRHTTSLQVLHLGITLDTGTWLSSFQQISKQMRALNRIQLAGIFEIQASSKVVFSPQWCLEAQNFILNGGELAEPAAYALGTDFGDDLEEPLRNHDLPEQGLWSDYDRHSNVSF
jgi:hypothetical protein